MCGFAGIFTSARVRSEELRERVEAMSARIAHRGPDDAGSWVDGERGVAFGFRRLSIIDLSEQGHQPMASASGRYRIVFNGEVYNFAEIREELERDRVVPFRGHSDTEVILAAFERWGIRAAVERFIGMFALAVWDRETGSLTLVRDRLGIKPLYVYSRGGLLLFGSELKALLAHPEFDRTQNVAALADYFRYLYVPAPQTIFTHARKLEPGCLLTIRDPASPLPPAESYWSVVDVARRGVADRVRAADEEMIAELEARLQRAVALRMRSDVPFGALLSGGVDSSTVAALMQEAASGPVRTFCIGFEEGAYDESAHAAAVARHLGTAHTEIRLSGGAALEQVPRVAGIFDEPFADPSQIPTLLVCELARRDVTVALSGDGGDEVFAGYNRYRYGTRAIGWATRLPAGLRGAVHQPLRAISSQRWTRAYEGARSFLPERLQERLVGEKITKLAALLAQPSAAAMYRSLMSAWQESERLVGGRAQPDAIDLAFGAAGVEELTGRMQLADQLAYLPDDLLAKVDRVSMAVSLEVRVPLLDHNVVEFAWRLPRATQIRDGRGKWILREVLYRRVPRSIIDRPKMGFSVPLEAWLRGALRPWAEDLLSEERLRREEVLDVGMVRRAWRAFLGGHGELALPMWTVLMYEAWRDAWSSAPAPEHALVH